MEGMLTPEIKENILGTAEVRDVFKVSKIGQIAGCMVTSGTITRNAKARLIRDDVEIADSKLSSLKRFKDDVREVNQGVDCGITLDKHPGYEVGDRIEVYEEIKIARKLTTKEYR
jgi:translation initiation factor IF-2